MRHGSWRHGSGDSEDGTFVPFTDILFNALLGFTVMLFIAFSLIRPEAKAGDIETKAEMIITVSWPDNHPDDIDTYVEGPDGKIVWYHRREAGLLHLDRDDRGMVLDEVTIGEQTVQIALNQETVTLRGFLAGEYVVNVFRYTDIDPQPVPVSVKIEKINPESQIVFYGTVELAKKNEEVTAVRFTTAADGDVTDINQRQKPLVRTTRER